MEMIRTFRIVATENESFEVRDFKYAESYSVSGTTATVAYYDDEFTSLSYDTIDLTKYEVRACPNKTSRKGVYYKARPLPSIASLMPIITTVHYVPRKIPLDISIPAITIPTPLITVAMQ